MPLHVSSTCAHHLEVKIALHSLWNHRTYMWESGAQVERGLSQPVRGKPTYRYDDTRGCVMQFWPPDDERMCSKHVEAWNKLTVKQNFCASSWLITKINPSFLPTYRHDDTRGCEMQFWPPDDQYMCSKHVEAWNKFTVKQKFCAWSWLITKKSPFFLFH